MRFVNPVLKMVKYSYKYHRKYSFNNRSTLKPPWNVLFFGNDDFSLASLKQLHCEYKKGNLINNLEVVTSSKHKKNPIEMFAIKEKLTVHGWPVSLAECNQFHIGLVVSFGYLIPEHIINGFSLGMLNVHASLLPRWRGAAPIIYALANGDKETGVTIMKIKPHKFDVGEVIDQASIIIPNHIQMPDLYHKLASLGGYTLVKTLHNLPQNVFEAKPQPQEGVTFAPRVSSKMSRVDWNNMSSQNVYNLYRALKGMFELKTLFKEYPVKLNNISLSDSTSPDNEIKPGLIKFCKREKCLQVQCNDGDWISVRKVTIAGKTMSANDFNNGFLNKEQINFRIFR